MYRLCGLQQAGIALAAGTDAPFGAADPWAAMQVAVTRRTRNGVVIGGAEALTPRAALALFLGDPLRPGTHMQRIATGAAADLCLLDRNWRDAAQDLAAVQVALTLRTGEMIWER